MNSSLLNFFATKLIRVSCAIVMLVISFTSVAQYSFQKTFGGLLDDSGNFVEQTSDGGYIIGGITASYGIGGDDLYLIKLDSYGDTLWTKVYGGVNNESCAEVHQNIDGGYIVAGTTFSTLPGNGNDGYLIRLDANGNIVWFKYIGGVDTDNGLSVYQTVDSGFIMSGMHSFGASNFRMDLAKTDINGNVLWKRTYGGTGNLDAFGRSTQPATGGGSIVAGNTQSFGAGNSDVYLVKTDANGDTLWTRTYGGVDNESAASVKQTMDGGYVLAGFTQSFGAGGTDCYIIKLNANGNLQWSKTYGGLADDRATAILQTSDGGYIFTGETKSFGAGNSDCYLVRTNSNGDTLWTKTYGYISNDNCQAIQPTLDGGFVLVGTTSSFGAGGDDVYLLKIDSLGNSGSCFERYGSAIITNPLTIESQTATIVTPNVSDYNGSFIQGNASAFVQDLNMQDLVNFSATTCDSLQVGIDTVFMTNQYGCDSLIITTTVLNPSNVTNLSASTCDSLQAGIDTIFLTNQYGCDSLVITTTTLNPSNVINFSAFTCDSLQAGVDTTFLTNQYGCDSLVITTTTLNPSNVTNLSANTCDSLQAGTDTVFLMNQYGCDSLVVTMTILNPNSIVNLSASTCDSLQAGTDTAFFTSQYGCDSIVITTTSLNPTNVVNISATSCDSSRVGIDTVVLSNQYGCDSVNITTITYSPIPLTTQNINLCEGDSLFIGGANQTSSGIYFDTLQNIFGCDSIVSSNLSVFPAFSDTVSVSVQEGEQVAGVTVLGDTIILIELNTANGCDSIIVNVVRVIETNAFFPTAFSPNGDSHNDIFRVLSNNVTEIRLMIFNRWGEKIFETNNLNIGWDGTYKGEPCEIGVYAYYAELTFQGSTKPEKHKGSITLIR